jgi:hypothetical protein
VLYQRLKPSQAGARFELLELVLQASLRLGLGIVIEISAAIGAEPVAGYFLRRPVPERGIPGAKH